MLTLTREVGQKIVIGDDIVITVVAVSGNGRVKIGIDAPQQVRIDREEVLERIRQENRDAASASPDATAWASFGQRRAGARPPATDGASDPIGAAGADARFT